VLLWCASSSYINRFFATHNRKLAFFRTIRNCDSYTTQLTMTKRSPYYVRKGRVDGDGHIRVVESSLIIMHNPLDVYGNKTSDRDAVTGGYTYPAPNENTIDDVDSSGYYYAGRMVDLIDSTPPSLISMMAASRLTPEEDDLSSLTTGPTLKPTTYSQLPSPLEETTCQLKQAANTYSQSLPYASPNTNEQNRHLAPARSIAPRPKVATVHKLAPTYDTYTTGSLMASLPTATSLSAAPPVLPHTGFTPPAPNMTYPYRPVTWSGQPILSLPNGSCVGQSIPSMLQPVITAISNLAKVANSGHPQRGKLKKPYEGSYKDASADEQLIRDHFAGGSGLLKSDSLLREWYGDSNVFSARMWEFLAVQKKRVDAKG
jgi:hypothetical protein